MTAFIEIHTLTSPSKKRLIRSDAVDLVDAAFTWQLPDGTTDYAGSKEGSVKVECGLITLCTAGGHEPTTVHCRETFYELEALLGCAAPVVTMIDGAAVYLSLP